MSIVNCRMEPAVFADGETVRVYYTIYNDNADKSQITSVDSRLYVNISSGANTPISRLSQSSYFEPIAYGKTEEVMFLHRIDLSLKSAASGSMSAKAYFAAHPDVRSLTVCVDDNILMRVGTVLNTRLAPSVARFELQRAIGGSANDEGEALLASLQLGAAKAADLQATLYCVQGTQAPAVPVQESHPVFPLYSGTWAEYEVSASSVLTGDTYDRNDPYCAFDVYPHSAWRSSKRESAPWIQLKMPSALYDIKVTMANDDETPAHGMTAGVVYGVEDDDTLVEIGRFSERDGASAKAESVIICTNSKRAFCTVRICASEWNGGTFAAAGNICISGNCSPAAAVPSDLQALDLTGRLDDLLEGVENDAELVPGIFSNGVDWSFLLVFGDAYERTTAACSVFRAFANLHLSGCPTGGACFGGFGTSVSGNPKLESHYPVYLYGGIRKLGGGWRELIPLTGSTPAEYGGGILRCRKIEDKCIVAGSLLVKPQSSAVALAQLPEGFMPESSVFSLNACNGGRIARIAVHGPDDEYPACLVLDWVKNLSNGDNYTSAEIWVQCSIEYWAKAEEGAAAICGEVVCGRAICGGE